MSKHVNWLLYFFIQFTHSQKKINEINKNYKQEDIVIFNKQIDAYKWQSQKRMHNI